MHTIEFELLSHSYKRFFITSDYKIINNFFQYICGFSLSLSFFLSFLSSPIYLEFTLVYYTRHWFIFIFLPNFYQITHQKLLKRKFFLNDLRSFSILDFHIYFSLLFQKFLFSSTIHLFTCQYLQEVVFINYSVTIRIVSTFAFFQSLKNKGKDCWKS